MRSRRRNRHIPSDLARAHEAFIRNARMVEEAKRALVAAAPSGRRAGSPLAEAVAAFDSGLAEAQESIASWRHQALEAEWAACLAALRTSAGMAEAVRLGEAPQGYERLYGVLGDVIEPLDAYERAAERFRELGL
jgi:hypothetical protein